ncbi:hypothetical protein JYJ95_06720 [Corallococcus exiguus]|uniref:hypothetical protein n=1 Tax=Corallococcus exiguus TaxID=83462 RepID=UPI001A8F768F|nr:hypothetical protein [Corallococcus exiguus]MBN8466198.1 hypothetical protein [Corallococcus exiguus]
MDTLERELVELRAQVEAVRPLVDWARAALELRDEADDAQTQGHVIVLDVRGKARVSVTVEQLRAAVAVFPPPTPSPLLTTPAMRRTAVAYLLETTPASQLGLLRKRLHDEAQLMQLGGCAVCWAPRSFAEVYHERADVPAGTCSSERCRELWSEARNREGSWRQQVRTAGSEEAVHD